MQTKGDEVRARRNTIDFFVDFCSHRCIRESHGHLYVYARRWHDVPGDPNDSTQKLVSKNLVVSFMLEHKLAIEFSETEAAQRATFDAGILKYST